MKKLLGKNEKVEVVFGSGATFNVANAYLMKILLDEDVKTFDNIVYLVTSSDVIINDEWEGEELHFYSEEMKSKYENIVGVEYSKDINLLLENAIRYFLDIKNIDDISVSSYSNDGCSISSYGFTVPACLLNKDSIFGELMKDKVCVNLNIPYSVMDELLSLYTEKNCVSFESVKKSLSNEFNKNIIEKYLGKDAYFNGSWLAKIILAKYLNTEKYNVDVTSDRGYYSENGYVRNVVCIRIPFSVYICN